MKYRIVFFGTSDFAQHILNNLLSEHQVICVVTQPDKPHGRSKKLVPSPVKEFALNKNIDVLTPLRVSGIEDDLKALKADFFVVAVYGKYLPQEILDLPEYTTLNVHPSLLPKYRGPSPVLAAILNGDKETGNTIMIISTKMDAGSILSQSRIPISPADTTQTLTKNLSEDGSNLLLKTINDFKNLVPNPQEESQATYTKIINKEDGHINWNKKADKIEREIRAFYPWPLAFTFWQEVRLNVLKAEVSDKTLEAGKVMIENGDLYIGTKSFALKILEIQPAGKNPMNSKDFINGYRSINESQLT
ncbi:TPA: methionyl-tRNA formyltransferase [candidate division CPR2 bacterium]|uniref:Methionyl-tRNA formyltransferase n=1 Tax=candidate division CPR2 bacterium GW2011_GWC1_41_48 TaxID=1618344 RepID=A0A0G0W9H1_UNCC2|nr:MAG: Methionyl-tRNA formyltransferase [candidate division CPR2 bacterium GW2011_GWC2_39_35]KKR29484.1 MAG: Methionyl-tRNA formyltransferase [candidate division CPR2 bacterium GW2011_GWD2_39_7]KKR29709.1 MAG: Methionyl-tRNA formyltransferase [candidate division CPR2 bacterium GW2011_GWD1_39_7]KKS09639.1 MAG: Methionyl-tRNA formyltransferase [candidate division CPR2 bacterium GW2011_GWC1_41_48]OGB59494.1 MAG: methionyl-tRNA formyltransferase [candidate division CPR2 bacterium GWD1_39_7]OGB717